MRRTRWAAGVGAGLLALMALPTAALADGRTLQLANDGKLPLEVGLNSVWLLVAGILVMFMQAGFAFLEIGFSRGKNAGTVVAKILLNFSICAICFYAVGFAFAFGDGNSIIGTSGFFLAGADASASWRPRVSAAWPRWFVANWDSQPAGVLTRSGSAMMPALFTRMCSGPVQSATKAATLSWSARSSRATCIGPATSVAAAGLRTARVTSAPALASARAVTRPMPVLAPVMSTTRSAGADGSGGITTW